MVPLAPGLSPVVRISLKLALFMTVPPDTKSISVWPLTVVVADMPPVPSVPPVAVLTPVPEPPLELAPPVAVDAPPVFAPPAPGLPPVVAQGSLDEPPPTLFESQVVDGVPLHPKAMYSAAATVRADRTKLNLRVIIQFPVSSRDSPLQAGSLSTIPSERTRATKP